MTTKSILFKNQCFSAQWGGGINYHLSLAKAIAKNKDTVCIRFPSSMNFAELKSNLPSSLNFGSWQHHSTSRNIPIWSELIAALKEKKFDVLVMQTNHAPSYTFNKCAYVQVDFPQVKSLRSMDKIRMNSYQGIICNSEFTASWIKRYWKMDALVLYPPVVQIPKAKKQNIILSTGRFVMPGFGRSKRQDALIEVFKKLHVHHPDWELHLVGFAQDKDYIAELEQAIVGYPIYLHCNILRDPLEELISKSSIYWHAVGLDIDEDSDPIAMEHYGISTVEAMSAACVPIVINKGGQKEMIKHKTDGYLWNTLEELLQQTKEVISDAGKMQSLANNAEVAFETFSFESFQKKVNQLFGE